MNTGHGLRFQMVVLLRWVLIIATAYLVVSSYHDLELPPVAGIFIAGYLGTNLVLPVLISRLTPLREFEAGLVLFDALAVSLGLVLTHNAGIDFFPVYFLVIFIGALTAKLRITVGAALLLSIIHLATLSQFVPMSELLEHGYLVRIPFLFAVALFFGFVVARARSRQRAARSRARERRRAEALSAITHDIKSPLANVQSMAEMLLSDVPPGMTEEQENLLRRIHASVRHVIQLSVNLLDATRIDTGRMGLLPRVVDIGATVDNAVLLMRSAALVKGVTLQYEREAVMPLAVLDPIQVERALTNLIDNAVKYTPTGGTVAVALRHAEGQTVIEVRDTGPGMNPEEIPNLFEKFRRRPQASGIEGSGLGLYIVKAIMDAHGGSVDLFSKPGSGTTAILCLPRIERPPLETADTNVVLHPTAWRATMLARS